MRSLGPLHLAFAASMGLLASNCEIVSGYSKLDFSLEPDASAEQGGSGGEDAGEDVAQDAAEEQHGDAAGHPAATCPQTGLAGFVCVPAGSFTMGCPITEVGCADYEGEHEVTLTRAFWIGETEVTQQQWKDTAGALVAGHPKCGLDCPMEYITWFTMIAWCNQRSKHEQLTPCYQTNGGDSYSFEDADAKLDVTWPLGLDCPGYRLPVEAEWEYAARAGSTTAFPDGPSTTTGTKSEPNLESVGWYSYNSIESYGDCPPGDEAPCLGTHPVKKKNPNAWGLYDVHGNVYELVWDWYDVYPSHAVTDPTGPPDPVAGTEQRVRRGGCFYHPSVVARAAARQMIKPGEEYVLTGGLRLARTVY
jgi:formylglycine-generating enzyme required for sulfatase activity